MKKSLLVGLIIALGSPLVWAGHFTDILPPASAAGCVPVSNGYDYNCSTDSGAPAVTLAAPVTPFVRTATQLANLAPSTTGQLVIISSATAWNKGTAGVCISTGIGTGAWVAVSSLTAVTACN